MLYNIVEKIFEIIYSIYLFIQSLNHPFIQ